MSLEHRWAVDLATGTFLYGHAEPYDCDPGLSPGQIRVVLAREPQCSEERYSGDPGAPFRTATPAEIAAAATGLATAQGNAAIDELRIVKALALVVGDLTGKTAAQVKTLVIAKYKTLG